MINFIYAERDALLLPKTRQIIKRLPNAQVVLIDRWEDVFFRKKQNFSLQKQNQQLIIGVNREKFIYNGSDNCQNGGNGEFYYCTMAKNCIFSCDYCYLAGVNRSGNLLVFANIGDCFREADGLIDSGKNIFLPVSYDTDLYALEDLYGFVGDWSRYLAEKKPEKLTCEVRTKCGTAGFLDNISRDAAPYMVFTWTLTPSLCISS